MKNLNKRLIFWQKGVVNLIPPLSCMKKQIFYTRVNTSKNKDGKVTKNKPFLDLRPDLQNLPKFALNIYLKRLGDISSSYCIRESPVMGVDYLLGLSYSKSSRQIWLSRIFNWFWRPPFFAQKRSFSLGGGVCNQLWSFIRPGLPWKFETNETLTNFLLTCVGNSAN